MLVAAGARVRVIGRLRKGSLDNLAAVRQEIEFLTGDISQLDVARRAAAGQDIVMHLGAKLPGIGYNVVLSGDMFYQNAIVNLQMMEAARLENVERYLSVSSACVYRRTAPVPTGEAEGFIDDPEPTNFGYGWAKRVAEVQARAYAMEYPMQIGIVRPYNAYGPRDDFDWETSHVIPAPIRKVFERARVVVWGDGSQLRTFVHARDVARGMMLAIERHPQPDPINLSSDELVSVKDLVLMVRRLSGRDVPVEFDTSKPSGQAIRGADLSKAQALLGYQPQVSLEEGLAETIEWYRRHILPPQVTG
jgi:GDP-L-fucose synthase